MDIILFIVRVVLCVGAIVMAHVTIKKLDENVLSVIFTVALAVAYIVTLIVTNWTVFAILKIILFLAVWTLPKWSASASAQYYDTYIGVSIIMVISSLITGIVCYHMNIEEAEPEVTVSTNQIVSANDASVIKGEMSASGFMVWAIQGSIEEEVVFRYYYLLETGGIKLGEIDAEDATIFYIEEGRQPYIEKVETVKYTVNHNKKLAKEKISQITTRYNLYVPEGSLGNIYEFDAA